MLYFTVCITREKILAIHPIVDVKRYLNQNISENTGMVGLEEKGNTRWRDHPLGTMHIVKSTFIRAL